MGTRATSAYIMQRFNLQPSNRMPISIPNMSRRKLAELWNEMGFKRGAEIGVQEGAYSEIICKSIPGVELYCVDAWIAYPGYRDFRSGSIPAFETIARVRLAPYNCTIIKKMSMEALADFPDRSLDFVYVDANHDVRHVIDDVTDWSQKVKHGGIIAGHDYEWPRSRHSRGHVVPALMAYTTAWHVNPWWALETRTDENIADDVGNKARSWMIAV